MERAKEQKHILVVEDSPDLQTLLSYLFSGEGYTRSQAFNGKQALELLRSMPQLPSCILPDIMMPIMGGIQFREEQKKDPRLADIPVVVMTADSNSYARTQVLGVNHFIRKPITEIDDLLQIVEGFAH